MNYDAIKKAAEGYKADMVKFLRDMIAIPSESCEEEGVVKRIAEELKSLGYDKVASQIRSEREVGCKPFKNHHAEQIKLVSDFSWIDFGRLSDVKDLIIETLTADGAEEYMDAGRIEAITESVERRIRNLSELAMKQTAYPTASTEDDVEEDIAEDYTPKMTL